MPTNEEVAKQIFKIDGLYGAQIDEKNENSIASSTANKADVSK